MEKKKQGRIAENVFLVSVAATSVLMLPFLGHRLIITQKANKFLTLSCFLSSCSLPSSHECPFPFPYLISMLIYKVASFVRRILGSMFQLQGTLVELNPQYLGFSQARLKALSNFNA